MDNNHVSCRTWAILLGPDRRDNRSNSDKGKVMGQSTTAFQSSLTRVSRANLTNVRHEEKRGITE